MDLVPGQALVAGDMEGFAQGVNIAHQALKSHGKIPAVRQGPERGSVAGDDDPLAGTDPLEYLEGTVGTVLSPMAKFLTKLQALALPRLSIARTFQ